VTAGDGRTIFSIPSVIVSVAPLKSALVSTTIARGCPDRTVLGQKPNRFATMIDDPAATYQLA
jgi:hypothetical protein